MDNEVNLAFVTNGGAGTLFIQANFIYHVAKYLEDEPIRITIFAHKSKDLNDAVFSDQKFVSKYYCASERYRALSEYDVSVSLYFYPNILVAKEEKISHCPKLLRLLKGWQNFLSADEGRQYYLKNFGLDINAQILAIIQRKNCLNILDVTEELGIGRDYSLQLILHKKENDMLSRWGLELGEYITIQRGAYPTLNVTEVPKIWSISHYEELVRLLKKCFPLKKIVQLGESKERCHEIKGIDISLVGKTDWEDLKVLLKNAWLHIDGECGMVHLRKVLTNNPSVVLFGPTSIDFYGYDKNINIASDACPHWCCKLTERTSERCLLNGSEINRCMESIKPYQVLDKIVEWAYTMKVCDNKGNNSLIFNKENYSGTLFNPFFYKDFFSGRYVYYNELTCIALSKLRVMYTVHKKQKNIALTESPAYRLLIGDGEGYKELLVSEQQLSHLEHNEQSFWTLYSSIKQGYDTRYKIIVSPDFKIYDGHHRASILAYENGVDYNAEVLVMYSIVLFPFHKVPKGSQIILYGFGKIGKIYLRQIMLSEYVTLACIIDKRAYKFVGLEKELGTRIVTQAELFTDEINYDFIVLAMGNPTDVINLKRELTDRGIAKNKIIAPDGLIYI